jgi:hypothetical protein
MATAPRINRPDAYAGIDSSIKALKALTPDADDAHLEELRANTLWPLVNAYNGDVDSPGMAAIRAYVDAKVAAVANPFGAESS